LLEKEENPLLPSFHIGACNTSSKILPFPRGEGYGSRKKVERNGICMYIYFHLKITISPISAKINWMQRAKSLVNLLCRRRGNRGWCFLGENMIKRKRNEESKRRKTIKSGQNVDKKGSRVITLKYKNTKIIIKEG
jgi:hypothetical protein